MVCAILYSSSSFSFLPPIASIRVLSIDSGGVRGIILLTILRQLEVDLEYLGCPLRDYFDFVVGTLSGNSSFSTYYSKLTRAGGLIGISIFLMLWSTRECFNKFYNLVYKTFRRRKNTPLIISRLQAMLVTYINNCRYRSLAIEAAFQAAFGSPPKIFNPLSSDTKVAVITAPVKGKNTAVIYNYNGKDRPSDLGKKISRSL